MFSKEGNLLLEVLIFRRNKHLSKRGTTSAAQGCWDQFAASVEIPGMKFCSMSPHNVLGWSIYSKKKNLRKSIIWLNKINIGVLLIYADGVINMERNTRVSLSIVVIWMANVGLKRLVSENENWSFLGTKIPQQTWHQRRCVCVCVCVRRVFLATAVHSKISSKNLVWCLNLDKSAAFWLFCSTWISPSHWIRGDLMNMLAHEQPCTGGSRHPNTCSSCSTMTFP